MKHFFLFLLFLFPLICFPKNEGEFRSIKNLKPTWQILENQKLIDFDGSSQRVVHFTVDLKKANTQFIHITSIHDTYLFIDSKLSGKSSHFLLSCDSLKRMGSNQILISVFQKNKITDLITELVLKKTNDFLDNSLRASSTFSDFLMMASLLLLVFFTALFRANPQLTLDYLNVTKLFYFISQEENPNLLRITSSVTLLFYFFSSLLASLALVTVAHYSSQLSWSAIFDLKNTIEYFEGWLLLSLLIFGLFLAKLALGVLIAWIFDWDEITGFQFFNFVRAFLISLIVLISVSIICFCFHIRIDYFKMLYLGCILLLLEPFFIFLKLMRRTSFNAFHLFFYLCVTEIFPLMVLVKVLLF